MRNPAVVKALARAGCSAAYLGVESLNPKHLLYLGKTTSPEKYLQTLEDDVAPLMWSEGIDLYMNLQLSMPNETNKDRTSAQAKLRRMGAAAYAAGRKITLFPQLHVIYPGTPHFESALARGEFGPNGKSVFERFTEWEAQAEPILEYLGEHFAHGVGGIPIGLLNSRQLRRDEFEIDLDKLLLLTNTLRRFEDTKGVKVFRYGAYLAKGADERGSHA
jgi:radical SAM superfamily enzyme YgiQ (UPF0313 family)